MWKEHNCKCQLACSETKYKTCNKEAKANYKYSRWDIYNRNEDNQVTQNTQVGGRTPEDALGAVGGILGFAVGASNLSVVEVIVYCVLFVASMVYCLCLWCK